jgi:hypothetical protein
MLGQITEWFYAHLVGIQGDPEAPGFKRIVIKPTPVGDLQWARASYESVRGRIACGWRREGETFTLHVSIPANTTATVHVPAAEADDVTEGGGPAAEAAGVKFLRSEGDRAVYAVESGTYEFSSTY